MFLNVVLYLSQIPVRDSQTNRRKDGQTDGQGT